MIYLSELHQEISKIAPIEGISLGDEVRVDFAPEATQEQQDLVLGSLSDLILAAQKKCKISELSEQCQASIFNGFTSEALGSPYLYEGGYEDQINISTLGTAGMDSPLTCIDPETGIKEPRLHTAAQLHQVFLDGAAFKVQQIQKYYALKAQVEQAMSAEGMESIQW